jgi:hypothetical protein
MDDFNISDIEKILIIYANRPKESKTIVFGFVEKYIIKNIKMIKRLKNI